MWRTFGLAALLALLALAPAVAQAQQYFDYPRYRLPGRLSPEPNSPPGRVSPFPGNPGYPASNYNPGVNAPLQGDGRWAWVFTAEGGGVFENTAPGIWTAYPNYGNPINFLELYRTPAYVELYHAVTGIGIRLTNGMLYQAANGNWYPVFAGAWQQ
jgi:hypothetical protein